MSRTMVRRTGLIAAAALTLALVLTYGAQASTVRRCGDISMNTGKVTTVSLTCAKGRRIAREWERHQCADPDDTSGDCLVIPERFSCHYVELGPEAARIRCGRNGHKVLFVTGA